ncbi:MAG: TetR family transcriptional regulator [Acidimicrobiia bacterium]|nr:TetR family transcriptional regulator [Acidimicrobiia bacterium]
MARAPRNSTRAAEGRRRPRRGAVTAAPSRREEILTVAAALFARQGIANTTVRDIGEEAGILSGSLYHHFTSKEEMVEEIIRAALDPDIELDMALAQQDVDPVQAVRELIERALRFSDAHPDVAAIIADGRRELWTTERFAFLRSRFGTIKTVWTSVLERGVSQGVFRADLDPDLVYKAAMGAISATPNWYRPHGPQPIEAVIEQFNALVLGGILR